MINLPISPNTIPICLLSQYYPKRFFRWHLTILVVEAPWAPRAAGSAHCAAPDACDSPLPATRQKSPHGPSGAQRWKIMGKCYREHAGKRVFQWRNDGKMECFCEKNDGKMMGKCLWTNKSWKNETRFKKRISALCREIEPNTIHTSCIMLCFSSCVWCVCASIQYKSIWINYDKSSGIMAVLTSTHHYWSLLITELITIKSLLMTINHYQSLLNH